MSEPVLVESDGRIAVLTLNRPETRNPISDPDMMEALLSTLARLDADPDIRAIILTGAGSAFSSGGNLNAMRPDVPGGLRASLPARTRMNYRTGIQRIPLAIEAMEVPVIAAVNGPAIGAGCDLACMCDIRIASETARFAESFVKVGIVPGDGGAWLLPQVVGFSKACEMALTGDMIDAKEALACGLVSKIVPPASLLDEARAMAERIAANPGHAVRMTRRLLRQSRVMDLPGILDLSAALQALAHATEDHDEALSAMLEKRKPSFKGR
ncbi:crotonase/enoyl-CoA hydratase family protein [Enterovirga rhinocerotis]|uniref:Enoyl-CoA hydratase/carnithine racemase n=1 Tax=Enterovirga rhinocerotis TaxID=1339210 RepID=A0A4R7BQU2_9HYPH|nr:crotonase/enoyl-CoA hydratase family protein [Enterovirga rhinocerotis]TDR88030.1 enoyl-CoA hydratase/carnithine racemase [Enterovirga rhinocerotis]